MIGLIERFDWTPSLLEGVRQDEANNVFLSIQSSWNPHTLVEITLSVRTDANLLELTSQGHFKTVVSESSMISIDFRLLLV
jgi:hypothetical protein